MKRTFRKHFYLIPAGLFLMCCVMIVAQRYQLHDSIRGLLFGVSIGLMILPFMLNRFKQTNG